jgi:hypothetical protein
MRGNGWKKRLVLALCALSMGSVLQFWQSGCGQAWQNNVEVLFAPEASPTLIRPSIWYRWFGPGFFKYF